MRHWNKKLIFWVQTNSVCRSNVSRFCKNDSARASIHWLWLVSSRFIRWTIWLDPTRVIIVLYLTRVESESPKVVTQVQSLTQVMLSLSHTTECVRVLRHPSPFFCAVHHAGAFEVNAALVTCQWQHRAWTVSLTLHPVVLDCIALNYWVKHKWKIANRGIN